jgi:hypothetical protein
MPGAVMPTRPISSAARSSAAAREPPLWRVSTSAICEPTVNAGLRLVIGSWKIIAMRLPRSRAISRSDSGEVLPAKLIFSPNAGRRASRLMTASAVTDLPQPDSPTRQWVSPFSTRNEAPRTAVRPPNVT